MHPLGAISSPDSCRDGFRALKVNRAISSVGSEHLVYTERVGGSNPSLPTSITIPMKFISSGFLLSEKSEFIRDFSESKNPSMRKAHWDCNCNCGIKMGSTELILKISNWIYGCFNLSVKNTNKGIVVLRWDQRS